MDTNYKNILLRDRLICKLIYTYLPNELINIIKEFLIPKEWGYFIFIIKNHIRAENLSFSISLNNIKTKTKNKVNNNLYFYEYEYKYNSKNKKLNRKEYLLSKIKIKYKKLVPKNINKTHDKKLYLTENFLKKNKCLKCKKVETSEEPFVDYCNYCDIYYNSNYSYYLSSLNNYNYYENECPCCIRIYSCCRYN